MAPARAAAESPHANLFCVRSRKDTTCAGCGAAPITGPLFRCATCGECELCGACYLRKDELHSPEHHFDTILVPGHGGKGVKRGRGKGHADQADGMGCKGRRRCAEEGTADGASTACCAGESEGSAFAPEALFGEGWANCWGKGGSPFVEKGKG